MKRARGLLGVVVRRTHAQAQSLPIGGKGQRPEAGRETAGWAVSGGKVRLWLAFKAELRFQPGGLGPRWRRGNMKMTESARSPLGDVVRRSRFEGGHQLCAAVYR